MPVYVVGDAGRAVALYASGLQDGSPVVREAWVSAKKTRRYVGVASPGSVAGILQQLDVAATTTAHEQHGGESLYIHTPEQADPKAVYAPEAWAAMVKAEWEDDPKVPADAVVWRIQQALLTEDGEFASDELDEALLLDKSVALVALEYRQGWLKRALGPGFHGQTLAAILTGRAWLIRTHDPTSASLQALRRAMAPANPVGGPRRVWFAPLQDLADGGLRFPGTWEELAAAVRAHLQADETLWHGDTWQADVVIQVDQDGALWAQEGTDRLRVFRFRASQPGSWSWGGARAVVGGTIMFVSALARALGAPPDEFGEAVKVGVASVRRLNALGYLAPKLVKATGRGVVLPGLPGAAPAELDLWLPKEAITTAKSSEVVEHGSWDLSSWKAAYDVARGEKEHYRGRLALEVGKLHVTDPAYARTLLGVVDRINDFRQRWAEDRGNADAKPTILSMAIFGGPGSGKSFTAKELAWAADPKSERFHTLEFNVSQFVSPQDLSDAFEKVRGVSARGRIPLVLWDEFDTRWENAKGGWLSRFLMPMQDARFVAERETRRLESAIFVFIGGTFADEPEFKVWMEGEGKERKGVDFHSRLAAAFTVPSIHVGTACPKVTTPPTAPWHACVRGDGAYTESAGPAGAQCVEAGRLNRALLLRSYLKRYSLAHVDPAVLTFLLHVPLRHGARSLEQILKESALSKTDRFQPHHLAPIHALRLHVHESVFEPAAKEAAKGNSLLAALLHEMDVPVLKPPP